MREFKHRTHKCEYINIHNKIAYKPSLEIEAKGTDAIESEAIFSIYGHFADEHRRLYVLFLYFVGHGLIINCVCVFSNGLINIRSWLKSMGHALKCVESRRGRRRATAGTQFSLAIGL